jgi:sulfate/thiosulfate transport system permease protein
MKPTKKRVLPGFGLTLGFTLSYLSLIALIPLGALLFKAASMDRSAIWELLQSPRVLAALKLSFMTALIAAAVNVFIGLLISWVLVRYKFPGRRFLDALIDLPFALPTSVAGITLTTLFSVNGLLGKHLAAIGIQGAFSRLGIVLALIFIGLPFVIRTVQPILQDSEAEMEEVAAILGASRWKTFLRILLPPLIPALLTGFTLAFARAIGEYGSVIFISGNMPLKTEIMPLLIITKLEQYDYTGAAVLGSLMLIVSFALLFLINGLHRWTSQHQAAS